MRGALGSFIAFFCNLGILISFVFGYFFDYYLIPYLMAIPSVIFFFTFACLPETPAQLVRTSRKEELICKSLDFYKGSDCQYTEEIERIRKQFVEEDANKNVTFSDFSKCYFLFITIK